jgi:ABC-type dipeptide/oligopeptide/nickel transport system permease component
MRQYLIKRLIQFVPVFFGVTALTFCLIRIAPGDAAQNLLLSRGLDLSAEDIALVRVELGLDKGLAVQYSLWLTRVVRGDLGVSITTKLDAANEVLRHFSVTIRLAIPVMLLVLIIAVPLGLLTALKAGKAADRITRCAAILSMSIPPFCLGLLGILLFSVHLHRLPSFGFNGVKSMILPVAVLTLGVSAHFTRFVRTCTLEVLSQDYMTSAKSRGLSERRILFFHALPNALPPLVTSYFVSLALMLGGQAVVEKVFSIPGLGSLLIDSVLARDYPVVQGCVLLYAVLFSGLNLCADLLCFAIDPRLRLGTRGE